MVVIKKIGGMRFQNRNKNFFGHIRDTLIYICTHKYSNNKVNKNNGYLYQISINKFSNYLSSNATRNKHTYTHIYIYIYPAYFVTVLHNNKKKKKKRREEEARKN